MSPFEEPDSPQRVHSMPLPQSSIGSPRSPDERSSMQLLDSPLLSRYNLLRTSLGDAWPPSSECLRGNQLCTSQRRPDSAVTLTSFPGLEARGPKQAVCSSSPRLKPVGAIDLYKVRGAIYLCQITANQLPVTRRLTRHLFSRYNE